MGTRGRIIIKHKLKEYHYFVSHDSYFCGLGKLLTEIIIQYLNNSLNDDELFDLLANKDYDLIEEFNDERGIPIWRMEEYEYIIDIMGKTFSSHDLNNDNELEFTFNDLLTYHDWYKLMSHIKHIKK